MWDTCLCGTSMGGCSPALPSRPKSWGRKQAIPFGCNPCPYNARGGIIPGINILNSPSRPTQSKILRPVIAFLSWDYCVPEPKPQFWEKLGTAPPTLPAYPKLPGSQQKFLHLEFSSFFSSILSNSPAKVRRRVFSCRLPAPNSQ